MSQQYTLSLSLEVPREDGRYQSDRPIANMHGTATELLPWARTLLATLERLAAADDTDNIKEARKCEYDLLPEGVCGRPAGARYSAGPGRPTRWFCGPHLQEMTR